MELWKERISIVRLSFQNFDPAKVDCKLIILLFIWNMSQDQMFQDYFFRGQKAPSPLGRKKIQWNLPKADTTSDCQCTKFSAILK